MSVTENEAARQVNSANLRQWQAVLAADEWQRAWEALAEPEPEDERAAAPHLVACDRCEAVVPEDDCIGGDYCTLLCRACAEAVTGERWEPEEWGFDGEGEGL